MKYTICTIAITGMTYQTIQEQRIKKEYEQIKTNEVTNTKINMNYLENKLNQQIQTMDSLLKAQEKKHKYLK